MTATADKNLAEAKRRQMDMGGSLREHLDAVRHERYPPSGNGNGKWTYQNGEARGGKTIDLYFYQDEHGNDYLRVERTEDKQFPQSHWADGKWNWGKPKGPKIPFLLPELLAAAPETPVFICEGEKDALNVEALGLVATCASEGAGKWKDELNRWFAGKQVAYIIEDNDDPGRAHARMVARNLKDTVGELRIVSLPGLADKGDVSDWIAAGGTREKLLELCAAAAVVTDVEPARSDLANPDDGHVVKDLNEIYALVIVGDKAVIMDTSGDVPRFRSVNTFELWYANRTVTLRTGKTMPVGKYWIQSRNRRQYEGLVFAPEEPDKPGYYNLWHGFAVRPKPGDCSKFLAHLRDNVCSGDDAYYRWVVGWFADIVQNPAKKIGTSLVLRGKQGTGKTIVGKIFGSLLGPHYVSVSDPRMITGRFNSHLQSCLMLHADEGFWAGDRAAEGKLKDLVTGDTQFIEYKGKEAFSVRNYLRLLVTGNPDWMVPAGLEERRFAVFDVGEDQIQNSKYFGAIQTEVDNGGREALLDYLLKFDLKSVDLRTIPKTAALLDQKISSMSTEAKWWLDILKSGELPFGCEEPGVCPTKVLFECYVQHARRQGVARRSIETQIGKFLETHVTGLRKLERQTYKVLFKGEQIGEGKGRVYRFPPLAECREEFAKKMNQKIEWDDQEAWETMKVELGAGLFSS